MCRDDHDNPVAVNGSMKYELEICRQTEASAHPGMSGLTKTWFQCPPATTNAYDIPGADTTIKDAVRREAHEWIFDVIDDVG